MIAVVTFWNLSTFKIILFDRRFCVIMRCNGMNLDIILYLYEMYNFSLFYPQWLFKYFILSYPTWL